MAARTDDGWTIYDPDSVLPGGVTLARWIEVSFGRPPRLGQAFAPRFRVIEAEAFREGFASDRSHMRRPDGSDRSPPPPWPAIGGEGTNLWDHVDVSRDGPGRIARLDDLRLVLDAVVDAADQSSKLP